MNSKLNAILVKCLTSVSLTLIFSSITCAELNPKLWSMQKGVDGHLYKTSLTILPLATVVVQKMIMKQLFIRL